LGLSLALTTKEKMGTRQVTISKENDFFIRMERNMGSK